MSQTFKNLQDDLKDECQELFAKVDMSATRFKKMLNRGYKAFVKDTKCISQPYDFTTVANQAYYSYSDLANWAYAFDIIGAKYFTDSTEYGKELFPYPGGYNKVPRYRSYGEPVYYYKLPIGTSNIAIGTYPTIDVSSETLSVMAYNYPMTELSADANEPIIPDEYRDALVYYAAWRLFKNYSHLNPVWRQKAKDSKADYDEMVQSYKSNNFNIDQVQQVYNVDLEY